MTFDEAVALITAARGPADLFGGPEPAAAYRRLVKIVHPDVAPAGRTAAATAALATLSKWWEKRVPTVITSGHRWVVGDVVAHGDLATLRSVTDGDVRGLLKLPRRPADNDLLHREAAALRRLDRHADPAHRAYAPRLLDTVTHDDPVTGVRREGTVVEHLDGFVTLADVARAYPDGLDPRDAAWMWRRLLTGLGWAHRAGLVHGAVLPEHVLIHPAQHGVVLVDWCYAVRPGEKIPALVAVHRAHYPPEVPAGRPASCATDIHLAVGLFRRLIGDRMPLPLRRFADGCRLDRPRMRPQDAWRLLTVSTDLEN